MFIKFKWKEPVCNEEVFIADGVKIIGDVKLEKGTNLWYNAVIRGDVNSVTIGENTNIQDNCTVHVSDETSTSIGKFVTVGHNAIIHGCTIEDYCLIGMGATVLDGAVVGEGSVVGANALVTGNTIIPPNSLVLGSPAKVIKEIDAIKSNKSHAIRYFELSKDYK